MLQLVKASLCIKRERILGYLAGTSIGPLHRQIKVDLRDPAVEVVSTCTNPVPWNSLQENFSYIILFC